MLTCGSAHRDLGAISSLPHPGREVALGFLEAPSQLRPPDSLPFKFLHPVLGHPTPEESGVTSQMSPSPRFPGGTSTRPIQGLFLAVCRASPLQAGMEASGPRHTFPLTPVSHRHGRLTDCGKRREGGCTQMARETDGQKGGWLPVGQDPWAPCLGEGSFSALILPCWGGLQERIGKPGTGRIDQGGALLVPQAARPTLPSLPCCRVGSMELGSNGCVPGTPPGG